MAYISKCFESDPEWQGPYPNKQGEFCGNNLRKSFRANADGVVVEVRDENFRLGGRWHSVSNFRIGKPSTTQTKTSKEMEKDGYVGFYLISDSIGFRSISEIDVKTDILLEAVVTGQREPLYPFNPGVPMK